MMKNLSLTSFILGLLLFQGCQQSGSPPGNTSQVASSNNGNKISNSQQTDAPQTHLKVGDIAPDFTLNDTNGTPVKLSDFRGKKNVVLAFYVMAFTGG
jgi:hypothetical protein